MYQESLAIWFCGDINDDTCDAILCPVGMYNAVGQAISLGARQSGEASEIAEEAACLDKVVWFHFVCSWVEEVVARRVLVLDLAGSVCWTGTFHRKACIPPALDVIR